MLHSTSGMRYERSYIIRGISIDDSERADVSSSRVKQNMSP
jgi:hypothetical protein